MISMAPTYYYDKLSMTNNYIIFVLEVILLIAFLIHLFKKVSTNNGFNFNVSTPSLKIILLDILVTISIIILDIIIATFITKDNNSYTDTLVHMVNTRYKYLNLINTNIIGPITEELIIRGITFSLLKKYINNEKVLVIVVSVFFGFLHGISINIIPLMLFGAYSQILLTKTKNLSNCFVAHILNNIMVTIVNFVALYYL